MSSRLYNIAVLEPFIEKGYTLLTPNQRLARRIRKEWDKHQVQRGAATWSCLPVYPLTSWLLDRWRQSVAGGDLSPQLLLEPGQILQVWRRAIEAYGRQAGAYHLLRAEDAAELAEQARQSLRLWQVDWRQSPVHEEFERETDSSIYLGWLDTFEQILRESGQVTATDCIEALLSLGPGARASGPPVLLVECGTLAPLHLTALEHTCPLIERAPLSSRNAERVVHVFPERRDELQAAARWVVQTARCDPRQTIAIVTGDSPDERVALDYLLRREFGCLGANYDALPVNFSSGIPLAQAPLARDALAVLSLARRQVSVGLVSGLLKSRFLDLPDADSALAQLFLSRLHSLGREQVTVSDLRFHACETSLDDDRGLRLGTYLLDMYRMAELKQSAIPSIWATRFKKILDLWGWPGDGLDSLEYQQADSWRGNLDSFRHFDAVCGSLDFSAALSLLRDSCMRAVSHPQTVDANVQVLGPLEAAGLRFDHLWLIGVQASVWPAPARPNPFLPIRLQVREGMPRANAEHEWRFASARMEQYLRSCNVIHASYSRHVDGLPDRASPILHEFAEQSLDPVQPVDTGWREPAGSDRLERLDDSQAPAVAPGVAMHGGSSLLEAQSNCPFSAFARHRLHVAPLGDFGIALSAADRGTLLHEALYVLWGELNDHDGLMALDTVSQSAAISRAVTAAVQSGQRRVGFSLTPVFWELESDRMAGLLQEWLTIERQRGAFRVAAREQSLELELDRLQLRLRVDRVDELPDGGRVIIDYKSSVSKVGDWMGDRPVRPQLLLYAVAEPESTAALSFAQLRPDDCRFVGLGRVEAAKGVKTDLVAAQKAGMSVENWEQLNTRWREILLDLAHEFLAGRAPVDPLSAATCTWCGLQPLCRIERDETQAKEGG